MWPLCEAAAEEAGITCNQLLRGGAHTRQADCHTLGRAGSQLQPLLKLQELRNSLPHAHESRRPVHLRTQPVDLTNSGTWHCACP